MKKFKVDATQEDPSRKQAASKKERNVEQTQEGSIESAPPPEPAKPLSNESARDLQTIIVQPPGKVDINNNNLPSSDVKTAEVASLRDNPPTAVNPTPSETFRAELANLPDTTANQLSPKPKQPDSSVSSDVNGSKDEVKPDPATAKALETDEKKDKQQASSSLDESAKKKKKKKSKDKSKDKKKSKSKEKKSKKKKDKNNNDPAVEGK